MQDRIKLFFPCYIGIVTGFPSICNNNYTQLKTQHQAEDGDCHRTFVYIKDDDDGEKLVSPMMGCNWFWWKRVRVLT